MQRVATVTGGSAGIGKSICEHLLDANYEVISLDQHRPDFSSPKLHFIEADLCDIAATREAATDVARHFDVSTIVHNAGAIRPALLPDVSLDDLIGLTNLHLAAAITLTQAVLPNMKANSFGRIILVSSRSVLGLPTRTVYSTTKAGMLGMARTWALELGQYGITSNVVAPGPIQTTLFHEIVPADSPKILEIAERVPVKRLGRADDVARTVMFFASPDNGFITGQVMYVCGGTSVGGLTL